MSPIRKLNKVCARACVWSDSEPLPAPRTPTREEVDGFLRDDVYEMDDTDSDFWQELPELNELD